ncbi:MAG: response regulator [Pseudomonadota bacterium]
MAPIRNILIADKNPHVRQLISRELRGAGFQARTASTCREIFQWTGPGQWADLLVIDPELPDCQPKELLGHIAALHPELPVIIHAFGEPPSEAGAATPGAGRYVEKSGNSIPRLLQLVQTLTNQPSLPVHSPCHSDLTKS